MHRVVWPAVAAVAVHEQRRPEQGVIQRGIELGALLRGALCIDRRQRLRPLRACIGADAIEIEARHFGIEVGDGTGLADRRERHLHHQRCAVVGDIEHTDQLPAFDLRALRRILLARRWKALVRDVLFGVMELRGSERARETHGEIQLPAGRPTACFAKAGHRAIAAHTQPRPLHLARVVVQAGAQVDQHMRRRAFREPIAMHAHTRAGSEFGADVAVVQGHGVIAGLRLFAGVVELRGIAAARLAGIPAFEFDVASLRHQQDVAQIRMPGTGKMRVREPDDGGVAMPVAGRPAIGVLARLDLRIRAQLHHAERHRGTRIGMAFATGANERVDCVEGNCRRARRSVAENSDDGGKRCQPTSPTWDDQARRHAECSRRMQRRTVAQPRGRATPEDVRWPSPSWLGSLSRRVVIEVWPIGMHSGAHARRCRVALRPVCFPPCRSVWKSLARARHCRHRKRGPRGLTCVVKPAPPSPSLLQRPHRSTPCRA